MSDKHKHEVRPWRVKESDEVADYRIFKLKREVVESPDRDKQGEFFILDAPDWVNVIPVTPDGNIVFVRQYRHGSHNISLETPAGQAHADEPVEEAAARELREETGYSALTFTRLGSTMANSAFMTNRFTALLAEDATLTDPTTWDEHEDLEIKLVPVEEVPGMLARGEIENSLSALALSWFLLHRAGILQPE